jgi:hypothetical protein
MGKVQQTNYRSNEYRSSTRYKRLVETLRNGAWTVAPSPDVAYRLQESIPSWYQLSQRDNAIPPTAQEFMAKRMNAVIEEVNGSHTAFIAHPLPTATLIKKALT